MAQLILRGYAAISSGCRFSSVFLFLSLVLSVCFSFHLFWILSPVWSVLVSSGKVIVMMEDWQGGSWYPPARLHCQQKSKIENEKFKILREKNEKFKILERENEKLFFWNLKFKRKKSRIQNLIFTNQIALPAKLIKFSNWCSSSKLQI